MAFDPCELSALTYTNGFTLWHYKTPDDANDLCQASYFNDAAAWLRAGDFVFVNASIRESLKSGVLIVTGNSGGHVETAYMGTPIGLVEAA